MVCNNFFAVFAVLLSHTRWPIWKLSGAVQLRLKNFFTNATRVITPMMMNFFAASRATRSTLKNPALAAAKATPDTCGVRHLCRFNAERSLVSDDCG